ncbi:MAG: DNA mismatch repair endonuclease MutL [Deltaproteobacteria bacterium]|nr:DNA mismatch repair endonuclease MutL [Deltaproteobacteria bacterium]
MEERLLPQSPRIRVLPQALADQIAAGEVVERPASVVKELVENAIDAGARRIDIEIEGGGRRLVRVVDDGGGMTAEEARLALLRHATSKIKSADDLWGLGTFGFRGEALPSIAAVSRLALRSKRPGATAGSSLCYEAGSETSGGEVGMAEGTQVEVRDLFWNTPARLKFLKTEATEAANVAEAVLRLALPNPSIHFRLRAGGRVTLDLPPHAALGERVRAALARRGASLLHEANGAEAGVAVVAFLAAPEEAAATPRSTFLFVAKRFVRDRSLLHALGMGYGELLEKGRYPLAALFVEVPGQELDVNVHPQKLEVRFARPQEVYGAVRHVVAAAVARAPWLPAAPLRAYTLPPESLDAAASVAADGHPPARQESGGWQQALRPARRVRSRGLGAEPGGGAPLLAEAPPEGSVPGEAPRALGFFGSLAYVGQVRRTYLICESRDELVIVDQHAAHERITFERLRQAHRQRQVVRQRLLFPIPIEIDERAMAIVRARAAIETLGALGFEIEDFGPHTLLLRAVPDLLKQVDPKPLLLDVIAGLTEDGQSAGAEAGFDKVFATMACHGALRAGDVVSPEAARALLVQLDGVDLRSHCPHGRPVLLRMPMAEIEQRLGRT